MEGKIYRWLDRKTRAKRDQIILTLKAQGLTARQIVAQVGLSSRGVDAVLRRKRLVEGQSNYIGDRLCRALRIL